MITGFLSFLRVANRVSRLALLVIYYGMLVFIARRRLQFSQTRGQLLVRCWRGLLSCWKIFPFFYNQAVKHSTKVLLSLVITLALLPVLPLVVPLGVCQLIYYSLMSLPSWKERMSFILRPIQWSRLVKRQKSSLRQLQTALAIHSIKSGRERFKELMNSRRSR